MTKSDFSNFNSGDSVTIQFHNGRLATVYLIELFDAFIRVGFKMKNQLHVNDIGYHQFVTMFKVIEVEPLPEASEHAITLMSPFERAAREWCKENPLAA